MRLFAAVSLPLFVLSLPVCAQSGNPNPGKTKIVALDPGYVRIGQKNTVIVSGKHLDAVHACTFIPVSIETSIIGQAKAGQLPESDGPRGWKCDVPPEFITGTGQLKVTLTVPDAWKPGSLILTLKTGETDANIVAVATILAVGADAGPSPSQSAAQGNGSQSSPFANCLNGNTASSALLNPTNGSTAPSVNCASSLLTDSEVKDNFGQHVGHTYYAIQVRSRTRIPATTSCCATSC